MPGRRPYKALKSGLAIDLAVSLASGKPLLGTFAVPRPRKVAVFNGESGESTLLQTARNVCHARGIEDAGGLDLLVHAALPTLPALSGWLADNPVDVVVLDPVYRLLAGEQASNLYVMGQQFSQLTETCLRAGATPVLVHHAVETLKPGAVPDLANLAYAGVKQFARQWLLLNRRKPYRAARPNHHRLWLVAGGSAGQGVFRGVTVDEGAGHDRWDVVVQDDGQARADDVRSGVADNADKRAAKSEQAARTRKDRVIAALDQLGVKVGGTVGVYDLRNKAGLNKANGEATIQELVEEGVLKWDGNPNEARVPLLRLK